MTDDQRNWSSDKTGGVDGGKSAATTGSGSTPGGAVATGDLGTPTDVMPSSTSAGQAASQTAGKMTDAAGQAASKAADAAGQTASQVANSAGQAASQVKQAAAPVTDQAKETAGQVTEQAKQQALTQISTQKEHAAGSLDSVAQALRQSGDHLRSQQQEPLANLAGTAAQRIEQFSGYVRNTDVNDMIRDVEQFARRQPAAFLGGAFTLGVLAARFLKSSGQKAADQGGAASSRTPSYRGYGGSAYASSGASRYPASGSYAAKAATSWLSPDSPTGGDPGSVDSAMPDPDLRTSSDRRAADRYGSGSTTTAPSTTSVPGSGTSGSGATAGGWGYTPRSGGRTEGEGR